METGSVLFMVQGSSDDPYYVTFKKVGTNLTTLCTCAAAENGMACKHRLNILSGDRENIVNLNIDNFNLVQKWVAGSDVETRLSLLRTAEQELDLAKRKVAEAKKLLSRSLVD